MRSERSERNARRREVLCAAIPLVLSCPQTGDYVCKEAFIDTVEHGEFVQNFNRLTSESTRLPCFENTCESGQLYFMRNGNEISPAVILPCAGDFAALLDFHGHCIGATRVNKHKIQEFSQFNFLAAADGSDVLSELEIESVVLRIRHWGALLDQGNPFFTVSCTDGKVLCLTSHPKKQVTLVDQDWMTKKWHLVEYLKETETHVRIAAPHWKLQVDHLGNGTVETENQIAFPIYNREVQWSHGRARPAPERRSLLSRCACLRPKAHGAVEAHAAD